MAKCPSCDKFCGMETQEPEVNDLSVNDRQVDYDVRVVRNSECCGDEIKEACFSGSVSFEVEGHDSEGCELAVDEQGVEGVEEGGGRYKKSYYSFELQAEVTCACGKDVVITESEAEFEGNVITIRDKMAASEMDEIC